MINDLHKFITIEGKSSENYEFQLYTFNKNDFEKLYELFDENESGVYIFLQLKRIYGNNRYKKIYCGESDNLWKRLRYHDRKDEILREGSNCFGIFLCEKTETIDVETDILWKHDFLLNIKNN